MPKVENFSKLSFSSEHQYVIVDTSTDVAHSKPIPKIAMTFKINYYGEIDDPPMLTLLINPQNMTLSFSKKVNPSFSRNGFIIEEWGENQDIITCSGKIGGYYIKNTSEELNGLNNLTGLSRYGRTKSESFKNLYNLLLIYRNNGAIYQRSLISNKPIRQKLVSQAGFKIVTKRVPTVVENPKNIIDKLGDLFLYYDNTIYQGSFDNFSIEEDSGSPYSLNYSFTFTVQHRIVTDNRKFNYYNQIIIESGDITKNLKYVKKVILQAINTERVAQSQETDIYKAAGIINTGTIKYGDPLIANPLDIEATKNNEMKKQLEGKGFITTGKEFEDISKQASKIGSTYEENEKNKKVLQDMIVETIKRDESETSFVSEKAEITRKAEDAANVVQSVSSKSKPRNQV